MMIAVEEGSLLYAYDNPAQAADYLEISTGSGIGDFDVYDETGQPYAPVVVYEKRFLGIVLTRRYGLVPSGPPNLAALSKIVREASSLEETCIPSLTLESLKAMYHA